MSTLHDSTGRLDWVNNQWNFEFAENHYEFSSTLCNRDGNEIELDTSDKTNFKFVENYYNFSSMSYDKGRNVIVLDQSDKTIGDRIDNIGIGNSNLHCNRLSMRSYYTDKEMIMVSNSTSSQKMFIIVLFQMCRIVMMMMIWRNAKLFFLGKRYCCEPAHLYKANT